LRNGLFYGTIDPAAVTHGSAPVLWRELKHTTSVSRHLFTKSVR
jgi:hypothetical protein